MEHKLCENFVSVCNMPYAGLSLRFQVAGHIKLVSFWHAISSKAASSWGGGGGLRTSPPPEKFNAEAQKYHFQHFPTVDVTYV